MSPLQRGLAKLPEPRLAARRIGTCAMSPGFSQEPGAGTGIELAECFQDGHLCQLPKSAPEQLAVEVIQQGQGIWVGQAAKGLGQGIWWDCGVSMTMGGYLRLGRRADAVSGLEANGRQRLRSVTAVVSREAALLGLLSDFLRDVLSRAHAPLHSVGVCARECLSIWPPSSSCQSWGNFEHPPGTRYEFAENGIVLVS